jgi:hypothetical protein
MLGSQKFDHVGAVGSLNNAWSEVTIRSINVSQPEIGRLCDMSIRIDD